MSAGVYVNNREVRHQGDGYTDVADVDVCKVKAPHGTKNTPFSNAASSEHLVKGSSKTIIAGNPIALEDSELSTSTGNEGGSLGGILSKVNTGTMTWKSASLNVKIEGKGVVRAGDITGHNGPPDNALSQAQGIMNAPE